MEQFFNFGSQGLRDRLAAEEDSFDVIVGELTGVKPKDIHPLFTWRHEHSDMTITWRSFVMMQPERELMQ